MARHQARMGNLGEAQETFARILREPRLLQGIRIGAQTQLDVLSGRSGFSSERIEFLSENFIDQLMDPASLCAMFGSAMTFHTGRFALQELGILLGVQNNLLGRGAAFGAFALEATLFPVYHNLGNRAFGFHPDVAEGPLSTEIQRSFLFLGALRFFGIAGRNIGRWSRNATGAPNDPLQQLLPGMIVQLSLFMGILSGHKAEQYFNLAPQQEYSQLLGESLINLIHFNGAERLLSRIGSTPISESQERPPSNTEFPYNIEWRNPTLALESQRFFSHEVSSGSKPRKFHPAIETISLMTGGERNSPLDGQSILESMGRPLQEGLFLREASPEDGAAYVDFLARHLSESGKSGMPRFAFKATFNRERMMAIALERWARPISDPNWIRTWLVWSGDTSEVVGHVEFRSNPIPQSNHRVNLSMGLLQEYTGRGLGKRMLIAAEQWARQQPQLAWIDLGVFSDNLPALKLYQRLGFLETGTRQDEFRLDDGTSIDAIFMSKRLR